VCLNSVTQYQRQLVVLAAPFARFRATADVDPRLPRCRERKKRRPAAGPGAPGIHAAEFYDACFTSGGFQDPSRIVGGVSFGQ
jgi:hypothetical protein